MHRAGPHQTIAALQGIEAALRFREPQDGVHRAAVRSENPLRILFIASTYVPEIGTTPRFIRDLAEGLAARGHDVSVVVPRPRAYMTPTQKERGAKTGVQVLRARVFSSPKPTLVGRALEWGVASLLLPLRARRRYDALITFSPPLPLAAHAIRRFRGSAKILFCVQDLYPKTAIDVGILRRPRTIRFWERVERFAYRNADHVIVDSEKNRDHVRARGARSVRIVESWGDGNRAAESKKENAFRIAHGLSGKFVVSYGGMFSPHQDLGTILDAAQALRSDPRFRFVLAGDGMAKQDLVDEARRRALPNVAFLPYIPQEEYERMLAASDVSLVMLAPTVATAVPGKVYAIMAAARPVLAATPEEGPVPEVLGRSGAGRWVRPGDGAGLARELQRLADEPGSLEEMGRRGQRYVREVASLDAALKAYEEMLRS